jgi:hypothetical protein
MKYGILKIKNGHQMCGDTSLFKTFYSCQYSSPLFSLFWFVPTARKSIRMRIIGCFDKHPLQRIIIESSEIHLDFVRICTCDTKRCLPMWPNLENPRSILLKPSFPLGISHWFLAAMWTRVEAVFSVRYSFLRIHCSIPCFVSRTMNLYRISRWSNHFITPWYIFYHLLGRNR